jgi:hypothetical protein
MGRPVRQSYGTPGASRGACDYIVNQPKLAFVPAVGHRNVPSNQEMKQHRNQR